MKNILRNSNFGFTKWCVALIAAGWMGAAQAQVSINGSAAVVENFNTLGTSATAALPSGWKMSAAGAGTTAGYSTAANVTVTTQAGSGSSTSGGRYNWGDGATATDRAIGFMTSGSYASPSGIMAQYQNNTGGTISTLILTFDIERYRINTAAAQVTFFSSTDGTTWTSQTSGDSGAFTTGASSYTLTAPSQTVVSKTVTITGLSIASGSSIYFKWNFNTTGSNSQGLGLDNVSVTATTSSGGTPPTVTGISPSSGLARTIVTITGTDFTGATAVRFNGLAADSFTVNGATSITATAPTGVTTGPISVTTPGGTAASSGNFTVPVLSITVPSSINEGDSSQIATVTATPAPTSDLTITLASSSATDLTVNGGGGAGATSTATISANGTEASFFLDAPADNTVDNDASVNLTATAASGYKSATAIVTVRNVNFNPPTIVVNKAYNSGVANGADDVVELLVIGNGTPGSTVNLQGMILKDYSSSAASDGGGAYIFSNAPLWSSVKAGTLIVLTKPGTTPPAEDVDGADFVLKVNLSNATYFTAGTGTYDIGGTELVQIKASGSAQAGSTGAIHSFAIGTSSAAQVVAAPAPKLICAASGNNPFAKNSTKALADFNGTDAAQSTTSLTLGIANNADNSTYISSLRGSKDVSISIDSVVAVINENAGLQAGKITVALSQPATEDVTVNLSASPSGAVTIPSTAVILNGASSASIDVTPIDDNAIAGNRVVTITGSATGWSSGNNTMTIVDVQFTSPSVVINEVVNGGTGGADVVELLVVQNNLNMVGMILKDFSTNMTGDAGRQFTFADNALWQSVKAGTLLVLTSDAAATEDTDASDGIVTIKLTNATYFTASGGTFDVSNTDMVMIKASGSGTSGITGAIHTFGNGPAGSLFNLANGAKLLFAAGGGGGGADNATSAIVDYNGTGVTGGIATLGAANNANNQTYITALRASVVVPPTITSTNAFSGKVGVAFSNTITATGSAPIVFSGTSLPGGLSVATNGVISGTPTAAGTFTNAVLTATNAAGTNNQAVTFTIAKGTPSITAIPTASAIMDGQALSASVLSGGTASVAGAFAWTTPSAVPSVGTASYGVTFTPTDTVNYNTAATTVSVTVNPAGSTFAGAYPGKIMTDIAPNGLSYLANYGFGGSEGTTPTLPIMDNSDPTKLKLIVVFRTDDSSISLGGQTSTDLALAGSWSTSGVSVDPSTDASPVPANTVRKVISVDRGSGSKRFLRATITR
jgi:hypothetical protein